jgi:hypothetical protein
MASSLSEQEINGIVERTVDLVESTTTADAIAYLLEVHKVAEQHPECTPGMRSMLTMEGALFCHIIQKLDLEAWEDGFALFQEGNDG